MTGSILATARLTLTPSGIADFDDSAAMWADPDVTRFIGGQPNTREEAWARLLRTAGMWRLFGYGYWAAREHQSGRFVGELGFMNACRELDPPFGDTPEAGWALSPWAHGKGYALEALSAVHDWLDGQLAGTRTVCMIQEGNTPSEKVAAKLGYRRYAHATYKGAPTILYERLP